MKNENGCASNRTSTQITRQHNQNHRRTPEENTSPPDWPRADFSYSVAAVLRAFTYSAVTLAAMYHGIFTGNQLLIYIACIMTAPTILRGFRFDKRGASITESELK